MGAGSRTCTSSRNIHKIIAAPGVRYPGEFNDLSCLDTPLVDAFSGAPVWVLALVWVLSLLLALALALALAWIMFVTTICESLPSSLCLAVRRLYHDGIQGWFSSNLIGVFWYFALLFHIYSLTWALE